MADSLTTQLDTPTDAPSAPLPKAQQAYTLDTPTAAPAIDQFEALPTVPGPNESTITVESLDSTLEFRSDQDPRNEARALWRVSAAAGQPLTGRELGSRFEKSERWGRDRIAEARRADGTGGTSATAKPARRAGVGKPKNDGQNTNADKRRPSVRTESDVPKRGTSLAGVGDARSPEDVPAQSGQPATPVDPAPAVSVSVPAGARLVAWAGFLFGTVISVAANVLHAWLPALAGEAEAPGPAVQVGAAVWPIALVISVEVLSRVPWRPGWAWQFARYGGAGVVAIGAALISYGHLHGVLAAWGYGDLGAAVGPLVVDGLMTISGFALLALGGNDDSGKNGNGKNGKEAR